MNPYYVKQVIKDSKSSKVSIFVDLEQEYYFKTAAKYKGASVIPGSFQIEMAYEAICASLERSDISKWRLEDIQFLRVPKFLNNTLSLVVEIDHINRTEHKIQVTSDVKDKAGRFLSKIIHSQMLMRVDVESAPSSLPSFSEIDSYIDTGIPGCLYLEQCPLHLGEYFNNVGPTLIYGPNRKSNYSVNENFKPEAFSKHLTPPLLVDAMMQNILPRFDLYVQVGIPKSIQSIQFYDGCSNDSGLLKHKSLQLVSRTTRKILFAENIWISNKNLVYCEMKNVEFYPLGYINSVTGEHVLELPKELSNDKLAS